MKVLVTGGTGFVGAHSAAALHTAGHAVRLLVRDPAKAARVGAAVGLPGDDVVVGDVTDAASVDRALGGCDAVLHAAASVSLDRRRAGEIVAANTAGARNVLRAAAERGVGRIVHVSSTSALDHIGGPLTASAPVSRSQGYAASKAGAEEVARTLQAEGAPVHITYPSGVLGPAAGESLGETSTSMARFVAAGVVPTPRGALSIVDVREVAEIHRRLVDGPAPPGRVMCGGTLLAMSELAAHLRELTGRRFVILPAPPAALRAAGRLADRVMEVVPLQLPLSEESMTLITTWPGTVDDADALGVRARPVEETLATALRAWSEAGLLTRRQAGQVAGSGSPMRA
jgi:nucleoside-diphosphate-sugar epimerase